jgi:hypothetical protein
MRSKTAVGVCATILYLAALSVYVVAFRDTLYPLRPDETAEFLAGAFSPLVFFWLVLGFFQQGDELRNSADALWLQGEELRHSVQQQRRLVSAQEAQLSFERDTLESDRVEMRRQAQPSFVFTKNESVADNKSALAHMRLLNRGATCTDFSMKIGEVIVTRPLFETGEGHEFLVDIPSTPLSSSGAYTASFVDALGITGEQQVWGASRQAQ